MSKLPEEFVNRMQKFLQEEFPDFMQSYSDPKSLGLRINTLKVSVNEFQNISPFSLKQIPWTETGFYYSEEDAPGKHPYHEAGLYYIQEPSAMAVAEYLDPQPGEKVLDLCAAPGGKTTHIAAKMKQDGLIVANEIHPARAKALSQNIERMGIKNTVVLNENPERLAKRFEQFFDRVLVDAPCSGEGMFRKDPHACEEWSLQHVKSCSIRQLRILEQAAAMVRTGGKLVYSTCTFSPEENEGVISQFLKKNPFFELVGMTRHDGFQKGRPEWVDCPVHHLDKTIRIWPHHVEGEGHFIAALHRKDGKQPAFKRKQPARAQDKKQLAHYESFAKDYLNDFILPKTFIYFGDHLYAVPDAMPPLVGLKAIRPGWHLGTFKKNRFEPSHALALSLHPEQANCRIDFNPSEILAYLRGESIHVHGPKGWCLITVDGYSIGWGKAVGAVLKNHFPKGLRWVRA